MLCMQRCNNEIEALETPLKRGTGMNTQVNKDGDVLQAKISSSSAHNSQEDVQQMIVGTSTEVLLRQRKLQILTMWCNFYPPIGPEDLSESISSFTPFQQIEEFLKRELSH